MYQPWYLEYAKRLLASILGSKPELEGLLEIVVV